MQIIKEIENRVDVSRRLQELETKELSVLQKRIEPDKLLKTTEEDLDILAQNLLPFLEYGVTDQNELYASNPVATRKWGKLWKVSRKEPWISEDRTRQIFLTERGEYLEARSASIHPFVAIPSFMISVFGHLVALVLWAGYTEIGRALDKAGATFPLVIPTILMSLLVFKVFLKTVTLGFRRPLREEYFELAAEEVYSRIKAMEESVDKRERSLTEGKKEPPIPEHKKYLLSKSQACRCT